MIKGLNIATGIKGIRKFTETRMRDTNWHIFKDGEYVGFTGEATTYQIIKAYSDEGYTFIGWTGNGLSFNK